MKISLFLIMNSFICITRTIMEQRKRFSRTIHWVWRAVWFALRVTFALADVTCTHRKKGPLTSVAFSSSQQRYITFLEISLFFSLEEWKNVWSCFLWRCSNWWEFPKCIHQICQRIWVHLIVPRSLWLAADRLLFHVQLSSLVWDILIWPSLKRVSALAV